MNMTILKALIIAFFTVALFLLISSEVSSIDWETDQRLTWTIDKQAGTPDISGNGPLVHMVYDIALMNGDSWISYKRSTDNGTNWDYQQISDHGQNPKITISGVYLHLVYCSDTTTRLYYMRSNDTGETWGPNTDIGVDGASANMHSIASYGSNIYIVYTGLDGDLHLLRSSDNGTSWDPSMKIASHIDEAYFPQITSSGWTVHVAYLLLNDLDIYYVRNIDNGSTGSWSNPVKMIDMGTEPSISAHNDNIVIVTKKNGELIAKISLDGGESWGPNKRISANIAVDVDVVWSSHNSLHVVWRGADQGDEKDRILYSQSLDEGGNFSGEEIIVTSETIILCQRPAVTLTGSRVIVVWEDERNRGDNAGGGRVYGWEIYYRRSKDIIPPRAPIVTSPSHDEGCWTFNKDAIFEWSEPSDDSGISGYSYSFNSIEGTIPDPTILTTGRSITIQDIGDGIWYIHIRAMDKGGNWGTTGHYSIQIDSTPPLAPIIYSSTHPDNTWSTSQEPHFNWTIPKDLSGITGYSYTFDSTSGTEPEPNIDSTETMWTTMDIVDGIWFFHVRAVDLSGNWGDVGHYRIKIDFSGPKAPNITSPTHLENTWTASHSPTFTWTRPSDLSGILGFSFLLDKNDGSIPEMIITANTTTHHITDLADGDWILHVRAVDIAGNWGDTGHYMIKVDTTIPDPPVISSRTHIEEKWTLANNPYFEWTIPFDAVGIAGYSYTFDSNSETTPDAITDFPGNTLELSNVGPGIWYLHVLAVDIAGNGGMPDHYSIYVEQPPEVNNIWTSNSEVRREARITIFTNGSDNGGLSSISCEIQIKSPTGDWTSLVVEFILDSWQAPFTPDMHAELGQYSIRVKLIDSQGFNSSWIISQKTIGVLNNEPMFLMLNYTIANNGSYIIKAYVADVEDNGSDLNCIIQYRKSEGDWKDSKSEFYSNYWRVILRISTPSRKVTIDIRVMVIDLDGSSTDWHEENELIVQEADNEQEDFHYTIAATYTILLLIGICIILSGVLSYLLGIERKKQDKGIGDIIATFVFVLFFGNLMIYHIASNTLNYGTFIYAIGFAISICVTIYIYIRLKSGDEPQKDVMIRGVDEIKKEIKKLHNTKRILEGKIHEMEKDIEQENEIENSIKEIKDQIVTLEQIISDLDEREPQITREESYYRKEIRTNGSSIRDYNHISSLSKSQKGMNDSDEKSKFLSAIMIVILLVIINLLIHLLFAIVWLNEGSWEIDKLLAILLITFAGGCTGINWIYKNLLIK